jgi:hypothetical protein
LQYESFKYITNRYSVKIRSCRRNNNIKINNRRQTPGKWTHSTWKGSILSVVSGQVPVGNVSYVVPSMDRVRNFRNKTGSWEGSTHLQIIPTSTAWSSNFIRTLFVTFLRGPADSSQLEHKTATVAFITANMACTIHLARPYPNKEKRKELSSFHFGSAYWEIKSINKHCELQKASDRHNSAYHKTAEGGGGGQWLSTTCWTMFWTQQRFSGFHITKNSLLYLRLPQPCKLDLRISGIFRSVEW